MSGRADCEKDGRWRRSFARRAEMSVGESPKMKNLIKKAMRRAIESWPRRKPWVKESEEEGEED